LEAAAKSISQSAVDFQIDVDARRSITFKLLTRDADRSCTAGQLALSLRQTGITEVGQNFGKYVPETPRPY
jgi:hypothetical protein